MTVFIDSIYALGRIAGQTDIYDDVEISIPCELPDLQVIHGDLFVRRIDGECRLPNLRLVTGGIKNYSPLRVPKLFEVQSTMRVCAPLTAPRLRTAKCSILADLNLNLPALETVGMFLSVAGILFAPKLAEVRRVLHLHTSASPSDNEWLWTAKHGAGRVIAHSDFVLYYDEETGLYSAGCRRDWTSVYALYHWSEAHPYKERARVFREAIIKNEERVAAIS